MNDEIYLFESVNSTLYTLYTSLVDFVVSVTSYLNLKREAPSDLLSNVHKQKKTNTWDNKTILSPPPLSVAPH